MTLVTLSPEEQSILEALAVQTKDAGQLRRAQTLLWLSQGERVPEVAERLHVSRRTIYRWADRLAAGCPLHLATRLLDGARPGRPRTVRGVIDPLINAIIDRDPRDVGYRYTVWTAALLRQYLQEQHHLAVSPKSVSLAITRLGLRWKRPRYDLSRRSATWRQAKGGSSPVWRGGSGR
jgi:transposase